MTRVAMHAPSSSPATTPDPIDAAVLLQAGYATVVHRDEIDSTMDEARRIASRPSSPLPALVVADRQSLGRGRQGARWWQAPGSLAASLVVDRPGTTGPPPTWSLACGIALAESLATLVTDLEPRVRWPNDIEVRGRKLAGVLVEAVGDGRAIFGIGVNTHGHAHEAPAALRDRLVTVPDVSGHALGRTPLLAAFLPTLLALLDRLADEPAALAERYRRWCCLTGRHVKIHLGDTSYEGVCRGIASDGELLLDTAAGSRRFASGSLTAPADVWRGA